MGYEIFGSNVAKKKLARGTLKAGGKSLVISRGLLSHIQLKIPF
jgi:hypothetical protein